MGRQGRHEMGRIGVRQEKGPELPVGVRPTLAGTWTGDGDSMGLARRESTVPFKVAAVGTGEAGGNQLLNLSRWERSSTGFGAGAMHHAANFQKQNSRLQRFPRLADTGRTKRERRCPGPEQEIHSTSRPGHSNTQKPVPTNYYVPSQIRSIAVSDWKGKESTGKGEKRPSPCHVPAH